MKRLALFACLIAGPALAGSADVSAQNASPDIAPNAPSAAVQDAIADWQMYMRAQAHVAKSIQALAAEIDKARADKKAAEDGLSELRATAAKEKADAENAFAEQSQKIAAENEKLKAELAEAKKPAEEKSSGDPAN